MTIRTTTSVICVLAEQLLSGAVAEPVEAMEFEGIGTSLFAFLILNTEPCGIKEQNQVKGSFELPLPQTTPACGSALAFG